MYCIKCENEITNDQIGQADMLADNERTYPPTYTCKECVRKEQDESNELR